MRIPCQKCGFQVETASQRFRLQQDDIKFCIKCGASYSEAQIKKMFWAQEVSQELSDRVSIWVVIFMLVSLSSLGVYTFLKGEALTPVGFAEVLGLMLATMVASMIAIMLALVAGEKKFKKLVTNN